MNFLHFHQIAISGIQDEKRFETAETGLSQMAVLLAHIEQHFRFEQANEPCKYQLN